MNITITLSLTNEQLAALHSALYFATDFHNRSIIGFESARSMAEVADMLPVDNDFRNGGMNRVDEIDAQNDDRANEPCDDMDGDHASALASAGFGTDEDYGGGCHHCGDDY